MSDAAAAPSAGELAGTAGALGVGGLVAVLATWRQLRDGLRSLLGLEDLSARLALAEAKVAALQAQLSAAEAREATSSAVEAEWRQKVAASVRIVARKVNADLGDQ